MKKFKQCRWTQIAIIILGLTVLFIIDDVFLLILIGELRIWKIPTFIYIILAPVIFILNVLFAVAIYPLLQRKPATGVEAMIGTTGVALENFKQSGRVSIKGEIWQAESDQKVQKNETVRITAVSGLTLKVEKIGNSE